MSKLDIRINVDTYGLRMFKSCLPFAETITQTRSFPSQNYSQDSWPVC